MPGSPPDPVGEGRAIEIDPLTAIDLRLAIQRKVIGIFGHQHMRHGRFSVGMPPSISRDGAGACTTTSSQGGTRIWSMRHQDPELRRHDIQPFGDVFADPVQNAIAARAGLVLDVDGRLDARQMDRQRAAIATTAARGFGAPSAEQVLLPPMRRFVCSASRAPAASGLPAASRRDAKAMALHLLDDLDEPLAARPLGDQHRLEGFRIVGKLRNRLRHTVEDHIFRGFATVWPD